MIVSRKQAVFIGSAAIAAVIAVQAFNSFACYSHGIFTFLLVTAIFVLIPLTLGIISLWSANPLRAVGACLFFVPWLFFAFYTDCVRPYAGGGASMIYVVVLLYGLPCATVGALVTGPIVRLLGITVEKGQRPPID
jgi:hypothetical protein